MSVILKSFITICFIIEDIHNNKNLKMYLVIVVTLSAVLGLYILASHIWFYRRSRQSSLHGYDQTESYDEIGTIPSRIRNTRPLSEQQQRIDRVDIEHEPSTEVEDRDDTSNLSSSNSSIHESFNNHQSVSSHDAIENNLRDTGSDSLSWRDVEADQRHEYQNLYQSIMQEMADSTSMHLLERDVQPLENQLEKKRYINLQI